MILEALNYGASLLATPGEFRPALRYSINLWSRARRCAAQWASHEAASQAVVLDCVTQLRQTRTCVVLGSGLLRDVPVEALARTFDTVLLFDLVHLASVRAWLVVKGLKNVRCISRDLSGFSALQAGKALEPLAVLQTIPYLDFVLSANLLSQIGIGAQRRIEREGLTGLPSDAVAQLITAHVNGLTALTPPALLLADIRFTILDRSGVPQDVVDLMHGVALPEPMAEWDWPVAPPGEISKTYALTHRVVAAPIHLPAARSSRKGPRS